MRKAFAILGIILSGTPAMADDVSDGKALAEITCGHCHALGDTGDSPFKEAPPFRTIHENYEANELEDTFKQGIVAAHPAMPRWTMSSGQARQLAAFIMSFGPPKPP